MDHGGIGEKFFEGMINLSYLKKLKKRLHDTTTYFQLKGEKDLDNGKLITDDRRAFYFNAAKCVILNVLKFMKKTLQISVFTDFIRL